MTLPGGNLNPIVSYSRVKQITFGLTSQTIVEHYNQPPSQENICLVG